MKKILILLTAVISLLPALQAQEMAELKVKGRGKAAPDELIDKKIRDANGEICAGLMIISDMTGLTYSSFNQIVKINSKPGRDLLFLSPDERVVEVYKSGYKPLKIILNEHGVRLNSGRVWKLEITGDKKFNMIPVTINAEPAGSSIFIDNEARGTFKIQQVTRGIHIIRLEKEGYRTLIDTINAGLKSDFFVYRLTPVDPQIVKISSNPPGARIYLNSSDKGITNQEMFLFPGRYNLRLTLPNYNSIDTIIAVKEYQQNAFSCSLSKTTGTLLMSVSPFDSKLLINKEDYTGAKEFSFVPGKYVIEVSRPGYHEISDTVKIVMGDTISRNYTLTAKKGRLQFSVTPSAAGVRLMQGGRLIDEWKGLKLIKDLMAGDYTLECSLTGYENAVKEITIEEGKTSEEKINLKKIVIVQNQPALSNQPGSSNQQKSNQPDGSQQKSSTKEERKNLGEEKKPVNEDSKRRSSRPEKTGYEYSHVLFLGAEGLIYPMGSEKTEGAYGINFNLGVRLSGGWVLGAQLSSINWKRNEGPAKTEYSSWIAMAEMKYQIVDALWISLSPGFIKYSSSYTADPADVFSSFSGEFSGSRFIAAAGAGIDIALGDHLILTTSARYYMTDGPVSDDLMKQGPEFGIGLQFAL